MYMTLGMFVLKFSVTTHNIRAISLTIVFVDEIMLNLIVLCLNTANQHVKSNTILQ